MADEISMLRRIRNECTGERRALVVMYKESEQPIATVARITAIKAQIESLDRAIADELVAEG